MLSIIAAAAAAPTVTANGGACMPVSVLKQRMPTWLGTVPYSHRKNASWGYPTDCSGFVSWALNMTTKDGAPLTVKAYEWGSKVNSERIEYDDLRYGDVVTHVFGKRCGGNLELEQDDSDLGYVSGHVFFFDKWVDAQHNEFWAYESTETLNQTEACEKDKPAECFNHHVKKERAWVLARAKESCDGGKTYGNVTGGPQRVHADLLCDGGGWETRCVSDGGECTANVDCCSEHCFAGRMPFDPRTCASVGPG